MSTRSLISAALGTAAFVAVAGGFILAGDAVLATAGAAADPYSSDGTWLVPTEITPGTYRVASTGSLGYSKVCADYTCEIGTDGFISNDLYQGPGVLVIPSNAVSVQLSDVSLTRMS